MTTPSPEVQPNAVGPTVPPDGKVLTPPDLGRIKTTRLGTTSLGSAETTGLNLIVAYTDHRSGSITLAVSLVCPETDSVIEGIHGAGPLELGTYRPKGSQRVT